MESPSHPVLQGLQRLDTSSSDFGDQLCNVLYGKEYVQCEPNLKGDDLTWLVDYMDQVRHSFVFSYSRSGWNLE